MPNAKTYIIWDSREDKRWKAPSGKNSWTTQGAAKNSVMGILSSTTRDKIEAGRVQVTKDEVVKEWWDSDEWKNRYLRFKDQFRFECWECELLKIREC